MAKLVSKVYGDALFEAALEDNRLSGLSDEVTAVKEIIAANDDLSKLMDHPQIDKEEKVRIIEEIFGGRVSAELVGLMRMIIEKNHYKELTLVFDYFLDKISNQHTSHLHLSCQRSRSLLWRNDFLTRQNT